jgi:hypothetical protein
LRKVQHLVAVFASGFSSPAVLVLINAAVERVSGLKTKKAVAAQKLESEKGGDIGEGRNPSVT